MRRSPLDSPALGTGLEGLARPCGDALRPADPGRAQGRTTLGLAFSGGGFRATLAALGVLRFLADVDKLRDVRFASSVSGGSIANGVLACRWLDVRQAGSTAAALDEMVIDPIVRSISGSSLKTEILRGLWRALGARTRTDVLADALDRRFFEGRTLESLDPECRFIFNAANLSTGVRFAFERDVVGDYVLGLANTHGTGLRVATAVAASAAVPGAFAPMKLRGIRFPCVDSGAPRLLDGGAYDNTGLEALDGDRYFDVFTVVMNAGGIFVTGQLGRIPIVRDLSRSNSLLYRQSTALRTRWMVDRFRAFERQPDQPLPSARRGVLYSLATEMDDPGADPWRALHPEERTWQGRDLAFVPTVFDQLDERLCRLLVYRGWWLTGAAIARYHKDFVELPEARPPLLD
jgi:NTE family protein